MPSRHEEDMRTLTATERAPDEVVRWRREQLVVLRFLVAAGSPTAKDARYDLHALIELTEQGCEPTLAIRILAPSEVTRLNEPDERGYRRQL